MKKGRFVKIMLAVLMVTVICDAIYYTGFRSDASSIDNSKIINNFSKNDGFDENQSSLVSVKELESSIKPGQLIDKETLSEFASEFRTVDKEITINSIEDFYAELDTYSSITDEIVDDLLSSASDRVVAQYIFKEMSKLSNVKEKILNDKQNEIISRDSSNSYDIDELNKEGIKDITTDYYRANDNYKLVTTVESEYGAKMILETVEQNEIITKGDNWKEIGGWDEIKNKPFGDRMYSNSISFGVSTRLFAKFKYKFGYKVEKTCITSRYLEGDVEGPLTKIFTCSVEDKIKDTIANKEKENIDGTIKYTMMISNPLLPGGFAIKAKLNCVVTIIKSYEDSKDVKHYHNAYIDCGYDSDSPIWEVIASLL